MEPDDGSADRKIYYAGWALLIVFSVALGLLADSPSTPGLSYTLHVNAFAAFWAVALVVTIALVNRSRVKWTSFSNWFFLLWVVFALFAVIDIIW